MSPPYYCKSGPIDDLSELLLIKGITPDIYWGSTSTNHPPAAYQKKGFDHTPHSSKSRFANEANNVPNPVGLVELFSPYGNKLNINTASAKTLQLLPGMDANSAQQIVEQRAGPDGVDGTDDDVPFHSVNELNSGLPGGGLPGAAARRRASPGPSGGELQERRPAGAPAADWRRIATCAAMCSRCTWKRKSTVSNALLSASSPAAGNRCQARLHPVLLGVMRVENMVFSLRTGVA